MGPCHSWRWHFSQQGMTLDYFSHNGESRQLRCFSSQWPRRHIYLLQSLSELPRRLQISRQAPVDCVQRQMNKNLVFDMIFICVRMLISYFQNKPAAKSRDPCGRPGAHQNMLVTSAIEQYFIVGNAAGQGSQKCQRSYDFFKETFITNFVFWRTSARWESVGYWSMEVVLPFRLMSITQGFSTEINFPPRSNSTYQGRDFLNHDRLKTAYIYSVIKSYNFFVNFDWNLC